ncbi:MAG TPA: hypothetical protein VME01_01565, partial [Solirubrobacteraceae bacterium]|nr:hypothetical protein [Solirubrobacteraceae bacterium]
MGPASPPEQAETHEVAEPEPPEPDPEPPEPDPEPPEPDPEPPMPEPEPLPDPSGPLSADRLDWALHRLRKEIPATSEET